MRSKRKAITIILTSLLVVLIGYFLIIRPFPTQLTDASTESTGQQTLDSISRNAYTKEIAQDITQTKAFLIDASNYKAAIRSVKISGHVVNNCTVKVFLMNEEGEKLLVYTNQKRRTSWITAFLNKVKETFSKEKKEEKEKEKEENKETPTTPATPATPATPTEKPATPATPATPTETPPTTPSNNDENDDRNNRDNGINRNSRREGNLIPTNTTPVNETPTTPSNNTSPGTSSNTTLPEIPTNTTPVNETPTTPEEPEKPTSTSFSTTPFQTTEKSDKIIEPNITQEEKQEIQNIMDKTTPTNNNEINIIELKNEETNIISNIESAEPEEPKNVEPIGNTKFKAECTDTCNIKAKADKYIILIEVEPGTYFKLDEIVYSLE